MDKTRSDNILCYLVKISSTKDNSVKGTLNEFYIYKYVSSSA